PAGGFSATPMRRLGDPCDQHRPLLGEVESTCVPDRWRAGDGQDRVRRHNRRKCILRRALSSQKNTANMHAKNLALILEILPDRLRFVGSDPGKIGEVVANLVGNAMKYTDHGTVLVRATAKSDAPGVSVICFEVEDTG